tara:strand:- start:39 stop:425 length:387 start_codon:yes stop_codon:yes gene_type:complete
LKKIISGLVVISYMLMIMSSIWFFIESLSSFGAGFAFENFNYVGLVISLVMIFLIVRRVKLAYVASFLIALIWWWKSPYPNLSIIPNSIEFLFDGHIQPGIQLLAICLLFITSIVVVVIDLKISKKNA